MSNGDELDYFYRSRWFAAAAAPPATTTSCRRTPYNCRHNTENSISCRCRSTIPPPHLAAAAAGSEDRNVSVLVSDHSATAASPAASESREFVEGRTDSHLNEYVIVEGRNDSGVITS
uniref:Uncharacterized protein n=1 Tax=Oryza punctata TaxID=4537 RepID=A0A0E0L8P9_ORYPU